MEFLDGRTELFAPFFYNILHAVETFVRYNEINAKRV